VAGDDGLFILREMVPDCPAIPASICSGVYKPALLTLSGRFRGDECRRQIEVAVGASTPSDSTHHSS